MVDRKKIKFAVEVGKCPISDLCVITHTSSCNNKISMCQLPLILNPICLSDDFKKCPSGYLVKVINGKKYILYSCRNCQHRVKNYAKLIGKISDDYIIKGERLSKLLDELEKQTPNIKISDNGADALIKFLDYHLRQVSTTDER